MSRGVCRNRPHHEVVVLVMVNVRADTKLKLQLMSGMDLIVCMHHLETVRGPSSHNPDPIFLRVHLHALYRDVVKLQIEGNCLQLKCAEYFNTAECKLVLVFSSMTQNGNETSYI